MGREAELFQYSPAENAEWAEIQARHDHPGSQALAQQIAEVGVTAYTVGQPAMNPDIATQAVERSTNAELVFAAITQPFVKTTKTAITKAKRAVGKHAVQTTPAHSAVQWALDNPTGPNLRAAFLNRLAPPELLDVAALQKLFDRDGQFQKGKGMNFKDVEACARAIVLLPEASPDARAAAAAHVVERRPALVPKWELTSLAVDPERLREVSETSDEKSLLWIVANHMLSPAPVLERLMEIGDDDMHYSLARNISCPPGVMEQLAVHPQERVRSTVAGNIACPPDLLTQLGKTVTGNYTKGMDAHLAWLNAGRPLPRNLQALGGIVPKERLDQVCLPCNTGRTFWHRLY